MTLHQQAVALANRDTDDYIKRQGFTSWQLENETAVQNEVSAFWNECRYTHLMDLECKVDITLDSFAE